jgi:ABC-type multidrug transport system ATPase subunit
LAFLAGNRAGKSTLVRIISGLRRSNAERFGAATFRAVR